MSRPHKWICVEGVSGSRSLVFAPVGLPVDELERIVLGRDELEALRLLEVESLSQAEAARRMGVSRSTVSRIAERGRRSLVRAIVEHKSLHVQGGPVAVAIDGSGRHNEGVDMIVAVPHEKGEVNQHFGRTEEFLIARTADGRIAEETVYEVPGMQHNHSGLAGFLDSRGVDVILAGGMGPPMRAALTEAGFEVFCGVSGPVRSAVQAYLRGEVEPNESTCGHHHRHHHSHGHHHEHAGGNSCGHGDH